MSKDNLELRPFDKLQSIIKDDGKLSNEGIKNLKEILGENKKNNTKILDYFSIFLNKIDNFLFKKKIRKNNTTFHKRK
jgi:hypothetical protein